MRDWAEEDVAEVSEAEGERLLENVCRVFSKRVEEKHCWGSVSTSEKKLAKRSRWLKKMHGGGGTVLWRRWPFGLRTLRRHGG